MLSGRDFTEVFTGFDADFENGPRSGSACAGTVAYQAPLIPSPLIFARARRMPSITCRGRRRTRSGLQRLDGAPV